MKAKAIVFREANTPSLEELALPEPNGDEIVVKIHYSGVSIGTESSIFSGARTHNGTFPLVTGYMASGEVERTGTAVTAFKPGDRVVTIGARLEGDVKSVWGGQSSRQIVNQESAVKVPEETDMRDASLYILSNVGLNAVSMAGIHEHDTVLISGQGLIGQFFGQWARNRGASIVVIEPDAVRADLARRYVTEHVLHPEQDAVDARLADITQGRGPSVVVEATGSKRLLAAATRHLRMHSRMVFLSWYPEDIVLPFAHLHDHEVTAFFPMGCGDNETTRATLAAFGNRSVVVGDNLTDLYEYEHACEGYQRIVAGDRAIMGMVIDWRNAE